VASAVVLYSDTSLRLETPGRFFEHFEVVVVLNIDTTIGRETPEAFTVALYSDTGLGPETPGSFSLLCSSLTPAWGWRLLAPQKVLYPMLTCLA